ncbi:hypothetical protein LCGC14_2311420, partial [marine sediment metagenome]
ISHGADTLNLTLKSLLLVIDKNVRLNVIDKLCKKIEKISKSKKNILIAGHSLGGFAINLCIKENPNIKGDYISYGSYTPRKDKDFAKNKVRKHLYENDFFANNLLSSRKKRNMLIYRNKFLLNSHSLKNFLNFEQMNKDLIGIS